MCRKSGGVQPQPPVENFTVAPSALPQTSLPNHTSPTPALAPPALPPKHKTRVPRVYLRQEERPKWPWDCEIALEKNAGRLHEVVV